MTLSSKRLFIAEIKSPQQIQNDLLFKTVEIVRDALKGCGLSNSFFSKNELEQFGPRQFDVCVQPRASAYSDSSPGSSV